MAFSTSYMFEVFPFRMLESRHKFPKSQFCLSRQMLELIDGATKGYGHDFTDLNFDALIRAVQDLREDVDEGDAAIRLPSQNANSLIPKRYP